MVQGRCWAGQPPARSPRELLAEERGVHIGQEVIPDNGNMAYATWLDARPTREKRNSDATFIQAVLGAGEWKIGCFAISVATGNGSSAPVVGREENVRIPFNAQFVDSIQYAANSMIEFFHHGRPRLGITTIGNALGVVLHQRLLGADHRQVLDVVAELYIERLVGFCLILHELNRPVGHCAGPLGILVVDEMWRPVFMATLNAEVAGMPPVLLPVMPSLAS